MQVGVSSLRGTPVCSSVHPFICPSVHRDQCIFVCFKIMDTSVYFSEIYSVDT